MKVILITVIILVSASIGIAREKWKHEKNAVFPINIAPNVEESQQPPVQENQNFNNITYNRDVLGSAIVAYCLFALTLLLNSQGIYLRYTSPN